MSPESMRSFFQIVMALTIRMGFGDASGIDWILIGDSFTQGHCVDPGSDIAGQLRSMTNKNIINLGVGGNGPLSELATLKEYAENRNPKIVFCIYFEGKRFRQI